MSNPIDRNMARFIADAEEAWAEILDKHFESVEDWAPFGLYITSHGDVAAQFLEEGIEFWPRLKVVNKEQENA